MPKDSRGIARRSWHNSGTSLIQGILGHHILPEHVICAIIPPSINRTALSVLASFHFYPWFSWRGPSITYALGRPIFLDSGRKFEPIAPSEKKLTTGKIKGKGRKRKGKRVLISEIRGDFAWFWILATLLALKTGRARKRNKGRRSALIVLFTSGIYTRIPIIPIVKLIFIIHYRSRRLARAIPLRFCAFHGLSFWGQKFEDPVSTQPPMHPCRGSPTRILPSSLIPPFFSPPPPLSFSTRAHSLCTVPHACTRATRSFYGPIIRSALFTNRRSLLPPDVGCLLV